MATVLLADDNASVRYALAMLLRGAGYTTLEANGGHRAVQIAAAEHPDVIVADLNMPDMGGVEMLEQLRKAVPKSGFVGLSGGGLHQLPEVSLNLAMRAGAGAALTKPVGNKDLLRAIKAVSSNKNR